MLLCYHINLWSFSGKNLNLTIREDEVYLWRQVSAACRSTQTAGHEVELSNLTS